MNAHSILRSRHIFFAGSALAAFATLVACHSPAPETGALNSCSAITSTFRGFRQESFPTNWVCENGILRSLPGKSVDLITREKYRDFELELDWKVSVGANSGILYGVDELSDATYWSGPEMQINDDPNHSDGKTPKYSAGSLYDLIAPNDRKQLKPTGQYNHVRIVSRQGHVEHWLNGAKIVEYDWNGPSTRALINQSKFKDASHFMRERNGYIALQHHGDEVWFRSIRIRRLNP